MREREATLRLLLRTAATAVLACLGSLVFWSMAPFALGWHPTVVMTGSMMPAIRPGDVVVARGVPVDQLQVRQVVLVPDPDHPGRLRLHRLVRIEPGGRLVLRGDANPHADSSTVRAADVTGVAVLRVPFIGLPARAIETGQWVQVAAMAAALGLVLALALGPGDGSSKQRTRRRGSQPHRARRPRPLVGRRLAMVAALTVLLVVIPGGFSSFAVTTSNPTNQFGAATSFYPYRDAVLADTPILYWRLGEASGTTAANTATSGPTGTYYSTPTLGQPSALPDEIVNKSISFASTGSVTASTSTTDPAQFTVEAWIKTTTTAGGRIFGFGNSGTTNLSTNIDRQLYLSPTGKAIAGIRNSGNTKTVATSPLSYNDGKWHYLAATYNATTLVLYVDGAQVATTTTTSTGTYTGFWRAGTENISNWPTPPSGNNYVGGLDELAVYATALTATRISAHYAAATS